MAVWFPLDELQNELRWLKYLVSKFPEDDNVLPNEGLLVQSCSVGKEGNQIRKELLEMRRIHASTVKALPKVHCFPSDRYWKMLRFC